jgi:folate-dependent phosphoribosylglycinamide formyltransferase PurN
MVDPRRSPERVLFLTGPGREGHIIYHALSRHFDVICAIREEPVSRRKFLARRIRRLGWTQVAGQVGFQLLVAPFLRWEGERRVDELLSAHGLDDRPIASDQIVDIPSVNDAITRQHLRELSPDVVVINGTRIISKKTLTCIDAPFVNIHAGLTPHYRGVHGGYWAMRSGEPERFGVTVHLVDPGIDTGKILASDTCWPSEQDNFYTYPYPQLAAGIPLLLDAVEALGRGEITPREVQTSGTPLWSHPVVGDYVAARLRDGIR